MLAYLNCSDRVTIVYDTINTREAYKIAPWGIDGQLWTVFTRIDDGFGRELWRQEVDGPGKKVFDTFDEAKAYVEYCDECDRNSP